MKTINKPFAKQKGMSLIEAMIYLSLAVMALGAAVALGMKLMDRSGEGQEHQSIVSLITSVKELKSAGTYGSSGTNLVPSLIAIDSVPTGFSVSGGVIQNNSSGTVTVVSNGIGFVVTTTNVNSRSCVLLATKIGSNSSITTQINSGAGIQGTVSAAQATTLCSGNTNSVSWTVAS